MAEVATKPVLRLGLIANLFETLHENDIRYCHWKSNEHLGASMVGETDLDVLFDQAQKGKVEEILHSLGFKRFNAIRQKQYNGIFDFIGLDTASGKIVHLHSHFLLTIGEPYLKGYHFRIEERALESRVFNEEYGLYCIDPCLELILLFVRESLKLRHRDRFRFTFKSKIQSRQYMLREYAWLTSRISTDELRTRLATIFKNYAEIFEVIIGGFNSRQLHKLERLIRKENNVIRLYSPAKALLSRWSREATIIVSRKLAAIFDEPILLKRNNPRGGLVIAVIGVDGSGKSTVTENLKQTFGEKLDVYKIYFGRGDGKISMARKLLASLKRARKSPADGLMEETGLKKASFMRSLYKSLEAFLVAEEKRSGMKLMRKARDKGALVICDRYPQNQIMGSNDGPLLSNFRKSGNLWFRKVAEREARIYAQAEWQPPDIIFKLITHPEVSQRRKPGENSMEKLKAKIRGLNELEFKRCKVIPIDATRPLNEVLCDIKKEIWSML